MNPGIDNNLLLKEIKKIFQRKITVGHHWKFSLKLRPVNIFIRKNYGWDDIMRDNLEISKHKTMYVCTTKELKHKIKKGNRRLKGWKDI